MTKLSKDLQIIQDLEFELGNEILRIDEPAGSRCPYAIVFKGALHINQIRKQLKLPDTVTYWESRNHHYEIQNGYVCEKTRHIVSGPLAS